MNQRMLIIEDSLDMRAVLEIALAHGSECEVRCASTRDEALIIIKEGWWPHIILLDYHMPGMSHDALVQLVGEFTATPLAVISGTSANADIRAAVHAGLRGFIPKTSSPEHFALALQILLAGGSSVPAEILLDGPSGNNVAAKPWLTNMTEREREVLKGVTQGRSNKEIARQMAVAEVTVKLHLRNVFRKMDVKSRAEAAVKAVKSGFG